MMMLRTISKAWRRDTFTPPAGSARCSNTSLSLALRRRTAHRCNAPTAKPTRQPQAMRPAQPGCQQGGQAGRRHHADGHADEDRTGPQAAPLGRRDFSDVGIGHAGLAAVRQALRQPAQEQQDRCPHSRLPVGRQHRDGQAGQGQQAHRQDQRELASIAIADAAEQPAADGPRQEAAGEHPRRPAAPKWDRTGRTGSWPDRPRTCRTASSQTTPGRCPAAAPRSQAAPAVLCLHCYCRHCLVL